MEEGLNRAADALSRRDEEDGLEMAVVSLPQWIDWSAVHREIRADSRLSKVVDGLEKGQSGPKHYTLVHGVLFYKSRLVIP